jgi:hypothetical protein
VGNDLWTTRADEFENCEPRYGSDESDDLPVAPHLRDQDFENHHGFYLTHGGVLEAPYTQAREGSKFCQASYLFHVNIPTCVYEIHIHRYQ